MELQPAADQGLWAVEIVLGDDEFQICDGALQKVGHAAPP
jgi:hypothetical protein